MSASVLAGVQVVNLPHQDNYHDCGLFTLAYMEFFCYRTPKHIHLISNAPKGTNGLLKYFTSGTPEDNSHFLTPCWFKEKNPFYMRFAIMHHLLFRLAEYGEQTDKIALAEPISNANEAGSHIADLLKEPYAPAA